MSVNCCVVLCCSVVRCVPIETHLQDIENLLLQTEPCLYECKQYYCASVNMFTLEDIMNKLVENVHKLWKCQREQSNSEKSSFEIHLLLLQLNSSHRKLRV